MPMITCAECGKAISTLAKNCPACGAPTRVSLPPEELRKRKDKKTVVVVGVSAIALLVLAVAVGGADAAGALLAFAAGVLAVWLLLLWPIYVGSQIGKTRGHPNIGALAGFVAGWIGVLIYWAIPVDGRKTEASPADKPAITAQSGPAKPRLAEAEADTNVSELIRRALWACGLVATRHADGEPETKD